MRRLRWTALALVPALALTGCADRDLTPASPAEEAAQADRAVEALPELPEGTEIQRMALVEADIDVAVTGAADFRWTGRSAIHLTRVGGPTLEVNLLSMGFSDPVVVPADRIQRFRWAFDLLNAYDDQPGTFTMSPPEAGSRQLASAVYLVSLRVKEHARAKDQVQDHADVEELVTFSTLGAPCRVEIGPGELSGSLDCPSVRADTGEEITVSVRWRNGRATPIKPPEPSE